LIDSTIIGTGDVRRVLSAAGRSSPNTPIVSVHGASHDGRCYTQTPDGRTADSAKSLRPAKSVERLSAAPTVA
jgi:hypothetical protein